MLLGDVEDPIGIKMVIIVQQVLQQLAARELDAILPGIRAELLVTDDLGVGTHLGLGPQL